VRHRLAPSPCLARRGVGPSGLAHGVLQSLDRELRGLLREEAGPFVAFAALGAAGGVQRSVGLLTLQTSVSKANQSHSLSRLDSLSCEGLAA
jgi:hypothetical protein